MGTQLNNVMTCLHLGRTNSARDYHLNGQILTKVESERDIGVQIASNLKVAEHCGKAARTAMSVLGQILRAFSYRDQRILPRLYVQYVRPHLDFAVQAWRPWQRGDIDLLEKVQKKMVGAISGLQGSTYEDKIAELGLQSLEDRRGWLDMVQTYKIVRGVDNVESGHWFTLRSEDGGQRTREAQGGLNIVGQRSRLEMRSNFFSQRVVDSWNGLSLETKQAKSVGEFKWRLRSEHTSTRI